MTLSIKLHYWGLNKDKHSFFGSYSLYNVTAFYQWYVSHSWCTTLFLLQTVRFICVSTCEILSSFLKSFLGHYKMQPSLFSNSELFSRSYKNKVCTVLHFNHLIDKTWQINPTLHFLRSSARKEYDTPYFLKFTNIISIQANRENQLEYCQLAAFGWLNAIANSWADFFLLRYIYLKVQSILLGLLCQLWSKIETLILKVISCVCKLIEHSCCVWKLDMQFAMPV